MSSDGYGYPPETLAAFIAAGVVAVDMETVAVAAVCHARGVPWSAVRAISDRADDDTVDTATLTMVNPDGSPKVGAALRHVLAHPGKVPGLTATAARTAAKAVAAHS